MRQLGMIHMMYTDDNDGGFIHYKNTLPAGKSYGGWVMMFRENYNQGDEIFLCYGNATKVGSFIGLRQRFSDGRAYYNTCYGYNFRHIGSSFRYGSSDLNSAPANISQLNKTSVTILLCDAGTRAGKADNPFDTGSYIADDYKSKYEEADNTAHNGALNILHCDGHASTMKIPSSDNPYDAKYLNTSNAAGSLWHRTN